MSATAAPAAVARRTVLPEPPAWLDEPPDEFESRILREPSPMGAPIGAPVVRTLAAVLPPASAAAAALVHTPFGERWAGIVAMLEQRQLITALVRELALQAELIEQHDGAAPLWRLRVERESLRAAPLRDKLQAALAEALGIAPLRLELEAGTVQDTPARRLAAERQRRQQEAEQTIHNDPLVQEMLAQYKTARIVPGSIKPHG